VSFNAAGIDSPGLDTGVRCPSTLPALTRQALTPGARHLELDTWGPLSFNAPGLDTVVRCPSRPDVWGAERAGGSVRCQGPLCGDVRGTATEAYMYVGCLGAPTCRWCAAPMRTYM